MANEPAPEDGSSAREPSWRPSLAPAHRRGAGPADGIIQFERSSERPTFGFLGVLRKPLVIVGLGLTLLVTGAIAADTFLDEDWAQAETKPKPNKHASNRIPSG